MSKCKDCEIEFPYLQKAHIIAKHKGGTNDPSNIILICPNCHILRDHAERVDFLRKAWTPERRAKHSTMMKEVMRGNTNGHDGAVTRRQKVAEATHTVEAEVKRADSMKKAWADPEKAASWAARNAKVSASMKGNTNGSHTKGIKKPPLSPGSIARRTAAVRATWASKTPEQRAAHAAKISAAKAKKKQAT